MIIRVFTLHYGAAPYLPITRRLNERYCRKHGLEFVVTGRVQRGKRDALWSKVARAKELLAGCDLLVYLDADAVFVDRSSPPETLTGLLPSGKAMLIGEDAKPGVANTGVWVLRNSEAGRSLLETWDSAPERDRSLCSRWPLDEAGFNEQVMPAHSEHIELKPRRELNLIDGRFINHLCMLTIAAKTDALERLAERIG